MKQDKMSSSGRLPPLSSSYPHPGANVSLSYDGGLPAILEEKPTPARRASKKETSKPTLQVPGKPTKIATDPSAT